MAKFAIIEDDGATDDERFDDLSKAVDAATKMVTDTPDTEVEIVQVIKKVSSELKVDVLDVD